MNQRLVRLLFVFALVAQLSVQAALAQAAPAMQGVKGKLQTVTSKSLDIVTPSGVVHVKVEQPLTTYEAIPSDLSRITSDSYVGVTSVKQANGTEVAKQIKIFPAELRGLSEGSNMIEAAPGAVSQSRMTNGSVVRPYPCSFAHDERHCTEAGRDHSRSVSERLANNLRASRCRGYADRA